MAEKTYNTLFLCTGNSARSIISESLLRFWGRGRFNAFSAGSHPKGEVHPQALEILQRLTLPTDNLRSKSWEEFAKPDAPALDFVITVCDKAKGEVCPAWPGQPMSAHWGVADPAEANCSGIEQLEVFRAVVRELENRIKIFTSLRFEQLDKLSLQQKLSDIGKTTVTEAVNRVNRKTFPR